MVDFLTIPSNIEDPGTYLEVDPTRAALGNFSRVVNLLIIGTQLASATLAEATLTQVRSTEDAEIFFGIGSQIAQMVKRAKQINPNVDLWCIALDEGAGAPATLDQVFSGTATEDGTLHYYLDDEVKVSVPVANGDAFDAVAANVVTAVTDALYDRSIVIPSYSTPNLTWDYRHDGTFGKNHRLVMNLGQGEKIPAGIAITNPEMFLVGGTTDPDMDTATAAIGGKRFTHIASGLNDTTNLGKLADTYIAGRWAFNVKQWGVAFFGVNDTVGNSTTAGNAENSPYANLLAPGRAQKPPHCFAAEHAAMAAKVYAVDPALALHNQVFGGVYVEPKAADIFTGSERDTLLTDGLAMVRYENGQAKMQRSSTTYQTNAGGTPDKAFHDLVDVHNLMASLEELEQIFTPFVGKKLAPNGTQIPQGSSVITPNIIKGLILSWYRQRVPSRFVDFAGFQNDLIVEINSTDQNRLDLQIPERLVRHAFILAGQIQFILGIPFGQEE